VSGLFLTSEQREIRALAREFAEGEIRPYAAGWDADRCLDQAVFGKLGELGFMGMRIGEEYGGLDLDMITYLLVLEELGWGDASLSLAVAIHNGPVSFLLREYGTEEQKQAFLPGMATGQILGAFALSEAGAGSDARSLGSKAVRDGDLWRLDGKKKWVTNGGQAGLTVVFTGSGESEEGGGLNAFLVKRGTEGVRVGKREVTMGLSASETVEVEMKGVGVPDHALLGKEREAFRYAMKALDVGRVGVAAQAVGIARAAFEHARDYAVERRQFGRPLTAFQATQFKLAEMALRIEASRALAHTAGVALERGEEEPPGPGEPGAAARAAMAKAAASEASVWIADEAVQIFGGYGYMRHYPVEKLLRDAKGTEIYEGTNEIMRLVIARDVLREERART
jgi:alkylation response protein AidB-like acyl-CoA dehydrogenase